MKKSVIFPLAAALSLLASQAIHADNNIAMQSGCLGCHNATTKLVGPSFKDIAGKYADQEGIVDELAATVKSGSQGGKWGEVPMPPSPASLENIKTVISWMLTHK
ncbi:MAG: cytochrome C551 [Chromatiales bacterium]|nr:cytochrome C551 [Chromatiales bacterium]